MTQVERATHCIMAHCVVEGIDEEDVRRMIWRECPSAWHYFNDGCPVYDTIGYPGAHESLFNKSETYIVEADNAELRHYLARLGRRSRCFSRCVKALRRAVDLFVFAWNQRQRWRRAHPKYQAYLADFIT